MKLLNENEIARAIESLQQNKIIILPTDTIYGLSAIYNAENEKRINEIKRSPIDKPLIILISNLKQAESFVEVTEDFKKYILSTDPTTVVSKKINSEKTFALRLVQRQDIKTIIDEVGPIFSTSVNSSGNKFLEEKNELFSFSNDVDKVFFTEKLAAHPSKILILSDFSKKRWQI
jgi:L-threonylcarbamoyladenylate synthase